MDFSTRNRVGQILERFNVRSVNDLDREMVSHLLYELEGRVPITQFQVSVGEFSVWRLNQPGISDIEFDAQLERVMIKATTHSLYETVLSVFESWLQIWADEINQVEDREKYICKLFTSATLNDPYIASERQADVGLWKVGAQGPSLVVEVGVNESLREVCHHWFEGTSGQTKSVILVNITEENRPSPVPEDRTWELSAAELATIDQPRLARHIYDWHTSHNVPLVGNPIKYDLFSVRPGNLISEAVTGVVVPDICTQLAPRPLMRNFHVTLPDNEPSEYDPEDPIACLNVRFLTIQLSKAAAVTLPRQRAHKMASDFITRRDLGISNH